MIELDARSGALPLRAQMLKIVMRLMHYVAEIPPNLRLA
jgi:hypothetical protein